MNPAYRFYQLLWQIPWLRARCGRWLYKRLSASGPAPDAPFNVDFFGLRYEGNLRNTIDFSIYYYGAFEKPLLFFLRDCLLAMQRDDTVFCDVGANIGQHALFMSRIAGQVHAFEPYDKVRERLQHQIRLNASQNITVHPVGLSARDETLPFYAPSGRNEGIGSFDAQTVSKGNRAIGALQLYNGDDYFVRHGIKRVDLLKIDVEGFEKPALEGLQRSCRQHRPVIVCELTYGRELSFKSLAELQQALPERYALYSFATRKADGSKARRLGARRRFSGDYELTAFDFSYPVGQDDIVAIPEELQERIPLHNKRQ